MSKEYRKRITIDSKIHFGKPCIAKTRIPVENVLELVKEGIPFKKIIEDYYPDLKIQDINWSASFFKRKESYRYNSFKNKTKTNRKSPL